MANNPIALSEEEEFEFRDRAEKEAARRKSPKQMLNPVGEGVAALASGAVAGPVSGIAGLAGAMLPGPQGQGAEWARNTQEALTYQPKSEEAQKGVEAITYPFRKLSELTDKAGEKVTDVAGPVAGTVAKVGLDALPMVLGKAGQGPARGALAKAEATATLPAEAEAATASGYRLTPTQLGKGHLPRAVEGLAGSAKMEKLASVENQKNTNSLIKEEFGLPKDEPITQRSLENIRSKAGKDYEAVKSSVKLIKPDAQFKSDIKNLRGDFAEASKDYPDLIKNEGIETLIKSLDTNASPRSMVELTRKLRKDSTANLKSYDDPSKQALGFAQRNASNAIEEMIDRALTSVGKGDLVNKWQESRRTIAKTHDVEAALNETNGDVSARYLAKLYDKGRPLTGNMEKVARFGRAFEGSARDPFKMRDTAEFSYGDGLLGGLGGAALHGAGLGFSSLAGIGLVGSRPLLRRLALSKGAQTAQPGLGVRLSELGTRNPSAFAVAPSLGLRRDEE